MLKRIIMVLTAAAMMISLASCGKGGEEQAPAVTAETTAEGKKIITMYAFIADSDIKKAVSDFNGKSDEYQLEITEYAKEYPDDPLTPLNNDIIAGKLPDLILLNSYMPIDSYISKGFLADLYEFIDKDETTNRSDYLEGVLKAYETNGKLYELVSSFSINTLVGKSSLLGSTSGWTVDEFIQLADANPDKYIMGNQYSLTVSKAEFFSTIINVCYENFINRETGECSFNSNDFIRLMEFSNRFPEEIDREQLYANSNNYWDDYYKACRDGQILLNIYRLNNFDIVRILEKSQFSGPVTFKGYPGAAGNGAVFNAYTEIAITSKAANPEAAWDFVKHFLSDEYQEQYIADDSDRFPVKKSAIEKLAEKAKEKPYWVDENDKKIYEEKTYWNGSYTVNIGVNTDSDNQKIIDFINSVENISRHDIQINNIVNEEAATYFSGQKPADVVAEIIQNRVANYIAENR